MSIRTKFILFTFIPILILFFVFTMLLSNKLEQEGSERLQNKIDYNTEFISRLNRFYIERSDYNTVKENFETLLKDEDIVAVKVKDEYLDEVKIDLNDPNSDTAYYLPDVAFAIHDENGEKLADINMTYSKAAIHQELANIRTGMITLALVILVILFLIYSRIANIISRPVSAIIASLQTIDKGDLTHRLELQNDDEFKVIQQHFNKMVTSIRDSKEALVAINNQLVVEIEERQKTAKILSNVIGNIPYSIFWKDTQLNYIGCNENFARDRGKKVEDIIGQTDKQVAQNAKLADFYKGIEEEVIKRRRSIIELEHSEMKGDKEVIYSTSKVPLFNEEGEVSGLVGIYADITERKRKEGELHKAKEVAEAANKAKSEFLANMSHEIRTPMNGIMGMAEVLSHTTLDTEQGKYVKLIQTSTDSLLQVINDILNISRIESGRMDIEEEDFNLQELAENVVDSFAVSAHSKHLELHYEMDAGTPLDLTGDKVKLKQVMVNVIGNAIKFTEKGEVNIHINSEPHKENQAMLKFTIQDTGIGIPENHLAKIFKSFTQVDSSYSRRYSGTGLGLAISKQLVEMMGGTMGVTSKVGQGSTFFFTIPFHHTTTHTYQIPSLPKKWAATKVLVVENQKTNVGILERQLAQIGAKVTVNHTGKQALKLLRQDGIKEQFDIVLLNLHLPEINGLDVLSNVLNYHQQLPVPTILLTSSIDAKDAKIAIQKCKQLGVQYQLIKPIKPNELQAALVKALEKPMPSPASAKTSTIKVPNHSVHKQTNGHSLNGHATPKNGHHKNKKATSSPAITDKKITILLAEDHELNRKITGIMLKKMGYEMIVAVNGQEAVEQFNKLTSQIDLILMDVQMPVIDGITATAKIRESAAGKAVPIIALTAHAQNGDKQRFIDAGMNDYLSKPYKADEFKDVVNRYVGVSAS